MTYTYEIERRICTEFCDKYAFAHCESCPLYNRVSALKLFNLPPGSRTCGGTY